MSEPQAEGGKPSDAMEKWRELRDVYMEAWAKTMSEAVNSESYSQLNGAMLESYLTASAPLRDVQTKAMLSALDQLQMPSRADFVSLAERIANLELLLDDMNAKLDEIHKLAARSASPIASGAKAETKPRVRRPIKIAKKIAKKGSK
jgi:hypothetical protein